MKTVTRHILRLLLSLLACLLIGTAAIDAQSTKSSKKPQKTESTQGGKSTGKTQKPKSQTAQKSNGKTQKATNSQGAKNTGKQQKNTKKQNSKPSGKPKATNAPKSQQSLQNEQKNIKAEIAQTKKQIDENKQSTQKQLNSLDQLKGEIRITTNNINNLTNEVNTIQTQEKETADSITQLEAKVEQLKKESAKSLRDSRRNRQSLSELNLIFSSKTFFQALKRSSRIHQANQRAEERSKQLKETIDQLNSQKIRLAELKQQHSEKLTDLSKENATLLSKQKQTQALVADLKKQGNALQQALLEKQRRMKALDDEITRLIAEEKRKAEENRRKEEARKKEQQRKEDAAKKSKETKNDGKATSDPANSKPANEKPVAGAAEATSQLTGTFASNKGKLMFPVAGKYNIVSYFGRNQHEDLPNVEIDNSGIDILTQPGTQARAVFDGVVSMIVNLGGSLNVVMVRHGEYITVYSNIKTASVKKGDKVKAGQNVGTIYTDASDNNRTVLHFEVRKETQKLNPLQWVKR